MNTVRVSITGAAGQIGYALLFRIASGQMFGPDTRVELNLIELEQAMPALKGVEMELEDCAFPLLGSITTTSSLETGFGDADWALLVGSVPRKQGMERSDLLSINGGIFVKQGTAINNFAKKTVRTLVVGNPCNTNAWVVKSVAKDLPASNVFAMTMLDQNRALTQLAIKSGKTVNDVKKLAIWGNHSPTMFPDFANATIAGKPAPQLINDEAWLKGEFLETVQKRGAAIINARGASSAASAANAVVDTVRNLHTPTEPGNFFSVAVSSNGEYGVPEGLMFSYPIRSNGKGWEVVQGLEHDDFAHSCIKATTDELLSERDAVRGLV